MAQFEPIPGSENPDYAMDACNGAVVICDPQTNQPIFFVNIALLYHKSFAENAQALQQPIVNAINDAIANSLIPTGNTLPFSAANH